MPQTNIAFVVVFTLVPIVKYEVAFIKSDCWSTGEVKIFFFATVSRDIMEYMKTICRRHNANGNENELHEEYYEWKWKQNATGIIIIWMEKKENVKGIYEWK